MKSRIAEEIKLRYQPVAIVLSNEKPEGALQFADGRWGCVMAMYSAAARGRVAAFDALTVTCGGGKIGLGFCEEFGHTPGGIEYFLSTGRGEGYPEGEGYKKTPELANEFVKNLPTTRVPADYVIFKPLDMVDPDIETPSVVGFLAMPDQLSALVVLANFDRATNAVSIPFGAGCHSVFLMPYAEGKKDEPQAIVGTVDISARPYVDPDLLTFSVPWKMFLEMETNVPGSFLDRHDWKKVRERIPDPL